MPFRIVHTPMGIARQTPGEESFAAIAPEAVDLFESSIRGRLYRPTDAEYDDVRRVWNGMIEKYPALLVRCDDVDDVVAAVNFAREEELQVAVRGGGHNVAGTGVCDGGLVIDLTDMNGVVVDAEAETVRVEGGATLGDVDRATQRYGL